MWEPVCREEITGGSFDGPRLYSEVIEPLPSSRVPDTYQVSHESERPRVVTCDPLLPSAEDVNINGIGSGWMELDSCTVMFDNILF